MNRKDEEDLGESLSGLVLFVIPLMLMWLVFKCGHCG